MEPEDLNKKYTKIVRFERGYINLNNVLYVLVCFKRIIVTTSHNFGNRGRGDSYCYKKNKFNQIINYSENWNDQKIVMPEKGFTQIKIYSLQGKQLAAKIIYVVEDLILLYYRTKKNKQTKKKVKKQILLLCKILIPLKQAKVNKNMNFSMMKNSADSVRKHWHYQFARNPNRGEENQNYRIEH